MEKSKEELFEEAVSLGLNPHPRTGQMKLSTMISDYYENGESTPDQSDKSVTKSVSKAKVTTASMSAKDRVQVSLSTRQMLRKKQLRLVRIIVRSNNERKKEWKGETITCICAAGTLKKYVPFNNEKGWHVPQAILDVMNSKLCQKFKSERLPNGQEHNVKYSVKEYNIEILPDLTKKELSDLADDQRARGAIE